MENIKTVSRDIYEDELENLERKFPDITFINMRGKNAREIHIGINWPGMGTQTPEYALGFAEQLREAAIAAASFRYNGYVYIRD